MLKKNNPTERLVLTAFLIDLYSVNVVILLVVGVIDNEFYNTFNQSFIYILKQEVIDLLITSY